MYVLVPADKASSNIIVVCKKYYLEVVLGEVNDSTTYEHVTEDYSKLVSGHLKFMAANRIVVQHDNRCLPQFYWLPKLHKNLMVLGLYLPLKNALQSLYLDYLLVASS